MSTKISSPFPFTGETTVGVVSLKFTDGVAEFDGTLSQESAAALRANGYAISAPLIGEPDVVAVDDTAPAPEDDSYDVAPAKSATKAEWVDYGVTQGHDRGSLEEMTKAEIQTVLDED